CNSNCIQNECDEMLMYEITENYCIGLSDNQQKEKLFSCIILNKLSGDVLVTKVKNNSHINKEKYYEALENIARDHKIFKRNMFAFGKLKGSYHGYRLVTAEECKSSRFIQRLDDHYQINNGLMSLDDFVC